jgi:hypothetical protein
MTGQYYTISDFENIFNSGISFSLPDNIKDIISYLLKELNIPENTPNVYNKPNNINLINKPKNIDYNNGNSYGKKPMDRKKNRTNIAKEISNEDWESLHNFKCTKIIVNEGLDKNINDIRILLNKISDKNYEVQKEAILKELHQFMNLDDYENKMIDMEKIAQSMYDIISNNKFFSHIYADLYKELYNNFDIFKTILDYNLSRFHSSIDNISYVDPNTNYDEYCNYIKINDSRKSSNLFFVNLFKKGVIREDKIFYILEYFLKKSIEYIDSENKGNELEQITENIFIIVSNIYEKMGNNTYWETNIIPIITSISKMKAKDHKSLSNRVIFKYMDIIDLLDE